MSHFAPAVGIGPPVTTASPATDRAVARRPGVLIVEDEEGIRKLLALALPRHGFAVWVASDGDTAVRIYVEFRASIDVALLDVQMAGCDGPQTLAALQTVAPDVRACFMTGNAGRYTEQNLLDLGALAVVEKPFGLDGLANRLKSLIQLPASSPAA